VATQNTYLLSALIREIPGQISDQVSYLSTLSIATILHGRRWINEIEWRIGLTAISSNATLSTTNPTRTILELNPGLRGERPTNKRISHGRVKIHLKRGAGNLKTHQQRRQKMYVHTWLQDGKYNFPLKKMRPIPVAVRSKAGVCGHPLAGIAGSNPAGGCLLSLLCLVKISASGLSLNQRSSTECGVRVIVKPRK